MSTKKEIKNEKEPEIVKCPNCRQDIEAKKMFLHEGFCNRNNVFCEHCEKVYLKSDYEKHIKKYKKEKPKEDNENLNTDKKFEQIIKSKDSLQSTSTAEDKEVATVIKQSKITINPESLEYIHMPLTEEYKINNPIVISENGQILSNKNKNDYILSILGINHIPNYYNDFNITSNGANIIKENQDYYNNYMIDDINNILNENKLDQNLTFQNNNNSYKQNNNIELFTNQKIKELQISENTNNIYNNTNYFNYENSINQTLNNNKNNNFNNIYFNNLSNYNFNNQEQLNYNTLTYYPNKNKKIFSRFQEIEVNNTPKKELFNQTLKVIKNRTYDILPFDKTPQNKNLNSKVPTDSKSKLNIISTEQIHHKFEKNFQSLVDKNKINSNKSRNNKKIKDSYKKDSLDEKLKEQNIDENGIEDKKKEILHREIKPFKHSISFNNNVSLPNGVKTNNISKKINKEIALGIPQKGVVKKKLFSRILPQGNNNQSQFGKTQEGYFKNKNNMMLIRLDDNEKGINRNQKNKIKNKFQNSPKNAISNGNKGAGFYTDYRAFNSHKQLLIN